MTTVVDGRCTWICPSPRPGGSPVTATAILTVDATGLPGLLGAEPLDDPVGLSGTFGDARLRRAHKEARPDGWISRARGRARFDRAALARELRGFARRLARRSAPRGKGLSLFVVDKQLPGITVTPVINLAGGVDAWARNTDTDLAIPDFVAGYDPLVECTGVEIDFHDDDNKGA